MTHSVSFYSGFGFRRVVARDGCLLNVSEMTTVTTDSIYILSTMSGRTTHGTGSFRTGSFRACSSGSSLRLGTGRGLSLGACRLGGLGGSSVRHVSVSVSLNEFKILVKYSSDRHS